MAGPSLKDWTGSFASAVGSGNVAAIGGTIGNKCIHARVNASSGYWRMEFFDNDPLGWTDCNRMAAMPTGDLVMVGSTTSDISIWGCPSYTAIGSPDAFVARTSLLLFSIDCRWITGLRTSGMDSAFTAVAVDTSGNIYAAGRMAVFGDRIYEAIVAKFDGAGLQIAFTWFMGPNGDESVSDIVVDPTGTFLLLAVHTTNTTSLDFGLGNMFGQPAGLYLVKMSLTLTAVASAYVGPITGASIRINPTNDHIFLSGTYVGAEPVFRSGLAEATAHGGSDIIVLELGANMGPLRS